MSLTVNDIMQKAGGGAPFALLAFATLTFVFVGIFSGVYMHSEFQGKFSVSSSVAMAAFAAALVEGIRFSLLISSFRDFSDSKPLNGWIGLVASLGLVFFDIQHASSIAEFWGSPFVGHLFRWVVVLGFVLELRLILTGNTTSFSRPSSDSDNQRSRRDDVFRRASNGQALKLGN